MSTATPATEQPLSLSALFRTDHFVHRHLGPRRDDVQAMLGVLGFGSLDELVDAVVPSAIRLRRPLNLPAGLTESEMLQKLRGMAAKNRVFRSYIGMGYHDTVTPPVIARNVLENPGWYTAYTPYQPEIAQGRLEALLNFQTMIADLTGLEIANASLLDEATAAAEAMALTLASTTHADAAEVVYLVDAQCHPQTIEVVKTRAAGRGVTVRVQDPGDFAFGPGVVGALVQYPGTDGRVRDFRALCEQAHAAGALVTAACDLLALALLTPPGEWGADIAVGNSQRFGVPLGYGGPHAAFMSTRDQFKRAIPGRIIGVSRDRAGQPALRMALQTREQHIRRDKATSNICTAQVLLAVVASMYGVYHGPDGIKRIAERVHAATALLAEALRRLGYTLAHETFFDTLAIETDAATAGRIHEAARAKGINLRLLDATHVGVALDETVLPADLRDLIEVFALGRTAPSLDELAENSERALPEAFRRTSEYLTHPVFRQHHSETEMLRYIKALEAKDLSLTAAMIPLGSCTMKLNATSEMIPISWPEFNKLHPFAPLDQTQGYQELFRELEAQLSEITGFTGVSLQPNAGSQGEYAGLLVIHAYHASRGEAHRNVCLIPQSAHGTNPASAVMAGMQVVPVKTAPNGNVDIADLRAKAEQYRDTLSCLMITYPSTHGVFEAGIKEICEIVHAHGGQVYMDGANMNAQVGLCRPGDFGADVCHLNLHKTFCIPHGGGGPGMGPIGVAAHLTPFLPNHPVVDLHHAQSAGAVSAAPWGSPSILPISWAYITMMGGPGLTEATKVAILNANYIARRLEGHYKLLYAGPNGLIAHECILDTRPFKASAAVDVADIAKRIIDFGFHPPTVSFPVAGTLMVEPTESEPKEELDRFVEAMIAIRDEIREIESGAMPKGNNLLTNAPHTMRELMSDAWDRPYSRERAGFPTEATRAHKVWPTVKRIEDAFGDRNLICTCTPMEAFEAVGAA